MGIGVTVHGGFPSTGCVIANHLSYLDIVVLASIHPCVFVSKIEVARLPVIGWMTTMAGTVYVERGRGGSAVRAGSRMKAAVEDGLPVVFFPEGTTNTESELLKFHSGLIGQAILDDLPMTGAYIQYHLTAANSTGVTVRKDICWGATPMFLHVFRFLGLRGVSAEVRFARAPLNLSKENLHRKAAAEEARAAVACLAPAVGAN